MNDDEQPDDRLPAERDLAALLAVSRDTLWDAIASPPRPVTWSRRGRFGGTFVSDSLPRQTSSLGAEGAITPRRAPCRPKNGKCCGTAWPIRSGPPATTTAGWTRGCTARSASWPAHRRWCLCCCAGSSIRAGVPAIEVSMPGPETRQPGGHAPNRTSIGPRTKKTRKPAATTQSSGLISRALPENERTRTQVMKPAPIPLAIE